MRRLHFIRAVGIPSTPYRSPRSWPVQGRPVLPTRWEFLSPRKPGELPRDHRLQAEANDSADRIAFRVSELGRREKARQLEADKGDLERPLYFHGSGAQRRPQRFGEIENRPEILQSRIFRGASVTTSIASCGRGETRRRSV